MTRDSDTRRMAETAKLGSVRSTGGAGRNAASPDLVTSRKDEARKLMESK